MNQHTRSSPAINRDTAVTGSDVTLRIVTEHRAAHAGNDQVVVYGVEKKCLLCLVPLDQKPQRYPLGRRLRLKDSLAGGSARRNAGILARDPGFWDYLQLISLTAFEEEIDTRRARHFINRICGVRGRHELERIDTAAERFFRLIEMPFLEWLFADHCQNP